MTINRIVYAKILVILGVWWGWTVLVDFFVVPTVFRTIDEFFLAGELGIAVFSKLNNLELITGSALLGLTAFQTSKNRKTFPLLMMATLLWVIVMIYFTFLTPKITELTHLWREADLKGLIGLAGIPDIQQSHQFYHRLYVGLDTLKLLTITVMLTYGILTEKKWT